MKTLAVIAIASLATSCTFRSIEYKGVKYDHKSFGVSQTVGKISVRFPDGAGVDIENFKNDQVQAIEKAVEVGIREGKKLAIP